MGRAPRDPKGMVVCPNCKVHYWPDLGEAKPGILIQDQFPDATVVQREQLLSGLCSQECWNEYIIGVPRDNKPY